MTAVFCQLVIKSFIYANKNKKNKKNIKTVVIHGSTLSWKEADT